MLRVAIFMVLCLQSAVVMVDSARILGIFPIPSISHQVVFRALMLELARRGHELVIITPNPALPKDRPLDNVTEIDTGQAYQQLEEMMQEAGELRQLKRGVIMDANTMTSFDSAKGVLKLVEFNIELPQVKEFLKDKTQKFDLVFVEAITNYPLIVPYIFNAPAIQFSSFFGFPEHFETLAAVAWHPLFYPNFYRNKYKNLTLWEKIEEIYLELKMFRLVRQNEDYENALLKKNFGPDAPNVAEMKKHVQMLFVNSHPIFGNNRPVPPSVLYLGGLHLQPVKELPKELNAFLDSSSQGVVYVSFGTNVRPSMMDKDLLDAFLDAFKALPYDILWKYDGGNLQRLPKNVKVQKWFPQRDLLMHPNVKVFVTQGGLQSTDEAIDAAVPLVGIPMLSDQWYNVNKYLELGIGEQVDALTMTSDVLIRTVKKVIEDDSYRANIRRVRDVMRDQPQTALARAVYWTEHVLRHGGAHLQSPAAYTTWTEYLMSDVIIAVVSITSITSTLFLFLCFKIVRGFKRFTVKPKQS